MHGTFTPKKHILAISIASLFIGNGASAQTEPQPEAATVIVTGTRVANRTALDTTSPVDIISAESLKNAGTTEINQALAIALPSLNFPRPGLADGTDTIRPATLRGMGPDQTLVLVNSKRRHSSSLVNVNGTIGRGSSAVDMNTIPAAIVKSIEVLRDGAAAQYGSDAISGVVNLRLRNNKDGGEGMITFGKRFTEYEFNAPDTPLDRTWDRQTSRKRRDGQVATVSAWKGLALGDSGFLTIAAEHKDQERTERSGYDMRQQYAKLPSGAYDPREATYNRFNAWYGEPEMQQTTLFANAGCALGGGATLYGWASYQKRDARSGGFTRIASDARNVPSIYPDGFLPIIAPAVDDYSATGGMTWSIGDWDMDASLGYGKNKMAFTIENTLNRSIGPSSKTAFYAGGFSYDQLVLNLTAVKKVDLAMFNSPLNVAVGAEARREGYVLFAGEPDSYRFGGEMLNPTTPSAPGAQVFPGFRPANESDTHRTAVGAFVDLEANVTPSLLASVALRGERYSDFGSSVAGKFAARYDFSKAFALRGSVQNGFRAPSPQQQNFTTTSTNFVLGVPYEITTFRPSDPIAIALGSKPLEAEESVNMSLGAVLRMGKASLTIDAYRIDVENRIVLSENLTSVAVRNFLISKGFIGAGGGRFFINGVDTTTDGVDVVLGWPMTSDIGKFDFTLAANITRTDVTKVPVTSALATLSPAPILFDRINIDSFEKGQPRNKLNASANWKLGPLGATLRATRYGSVVTPAALPVNDWVTSAKTIVDMEGRFDVGSKLVLALGAENVFDTYPEAYPSALNTSGNAPFTNYSPFGRGGRYVYARANYKF
jgi:iron complex outermembrane receptor protein